MAVSGIDLVAGTTVLTFTGVGVQDETIEIGDIVYTFRDAPTDAFQIHVKSDKTTQAAGIAAAINVDGTGATDGDYGASHVTINPYVKATSAAGVVSLTARIAGDQINGIHMEMTASNGTNIVAGTPFNGTAGASAGTGLLASWPEAIIAAGDPKGKTISALRELFGTGV
jgi:hypothetical protein